MRGSLFRTLLCQRAPKKVVYSSLVAACNWTIKAARTGPRGGGQPPSLRNLERIISKSKTTTHSAASSWRSAPCSRPGRATRDP